MESVTISSACPPPPAPPIMDVPMATGVTVMKRKQFPPTPGVVGGNEEQPLLIDTSRPPPNVPEPIQPLLSSNPQVIVC